jgi:thiamine biosynthesis protein ThiS
MIETEVADQKVALTVNGGRREIPAGWSLADLLASLKLDPRLVVIEYNGIIRRDRDSFSSLVLAESDTVEILHFVGGG